MATPRKKAEPEAAEAAADQPELSYEEARTELLEVVTLLEQGGTTLEESLELWQRGERLATLCQHWLDGARERLNAALAADEE